MLYNKYRPLTFDDVCGQEAAIVLKNQVVAGKVGHAYLFTGVRGTGKTTCAKILARVVNCSNPVNGSPCGVCKSCKTSLDNTNPDIAEIDGASNNGVDNVRDLIKNVSYSALNKVKVYIIDEVHMLSMPAFNAMLKTLEEPPANTLFIFATTEKNKVPATIKSRCQILDFTNINEEDIFDRTKFVIEKEGFEYTDEGIRLLAKEASGSLRDALSVLESLNGEVTKENIESSLGLISFEKISELYSSLVKSDKMGGIQSALKFLKSGVLGQEVIERLSQLAVENLTNTDCLVANEMILSEGILAVNNIRAGLSDRSVLMHFIIKVCQNDKSYVKMEASAKEVPEKESDIAEEEGLDMEFSEDYQSMDDAEIEDSEDFVDISNLDFDIPDTPNCYQGFTPTEKESESEPKKENIDHDLGIRTRELLDGLSPTIKQLAGNIIVKNDVICIYTDLFGSIFLEENLNAIKCYLQDNGIKNVVSISVE